jgi:WD40 repeat protein
VNCIAWSPDGLHAASGGIDTNVEIWSVEQPIKHICIKNAHQEPITGIAFVDNDSVLSCASDASIKLFSIKHHQ